MRKKILYIALILGTFGQYSCDPDPCGSNDNIILKANLYTIDKKGVVIDTVFDNFYVMGLDCMADSLCKFGYMEAKQLQLNLSTISDSTAFAFFVDTFTYYYDTAYNMTFDVFNDSIGKDWYDTITLGLDSIYNIIYVDSTVRGLKNDTLKVYYTRSQRMESPDCGVYIDFTLKKLDYTTNFIDSIVIMQPKVDEHGYENMGVYF